MDQTPQSLTIQMSLRSSTKDLAALSSSLKSTRLSTDHLSLDGKERLQMQAFRCAVRKNLLFKEVRETIEKEYNHPLRSIRVNPIWFENAIQAILAAADAAKVTSIADGNFPEIDNISGAQLSVVLEKYAGKIVEDEHTPEKIVQMLVDYGYLISLQAMPTESQVGFADTQFVTQLPNFFPSNNWLTSDMDYMAFLSRRLIKNELLADELKELNTLQRAMKSEWKIVYATSINQQQQLLNLSKSAALIWEARERAFWNTRRPLSSARTGDLVPTELKKRLTVDDTIARLHGAFLADYLEMHVESLENQLCFDRLSTSNACAKLVKYCDAWSFRDQLMTSSTANNWLKPEYAYWDNTSSDCPESIRLKSWKLGLRDLMSDSLGVKQLEAFAKHNSPDKSMQMYLHCLTAVNSPTRAVFWTKAKQIDKQYLQDISPCITCLSEKIKSGISNELERSDVTDVSMQLFEDALPLLYAHMERVIYPGFIEKLEAKTTR